MDSNRNLYIPVILGTARMGRMSQHAARLVTEELRKCTGVETDLIDIVDLPLPTNDAGEAIKNASFLLKWTELMHWSSYRLNTITATLVS